MKAVKLANEPLRVTKDLGARHLVVLTGHVDVLSHARRRARAYDGFCGIGDGYVPLLESIKLLENIGYNGPVTAEVFPEPADRDEMKFLRRTRERLAEILP